VDISPEQRYAEEVGMVLATMGLSPAHGKLLGWLLICDPPRQSSAQLSEALGLSKGSVSTGTRLLERAGLIRRVPVPGQRGRFYEMSPDAVVKIVEGGNRFREFRELMDRGLAVLSSLGATSSRTERLRQMRDLYAFIERELPKLMERFHHG
jgi:DNA-binding transcriptional regulator GbsR (MarR family)